MRCGVRRVRSAAAHDAQAQARVHGRARRRLDPRPRRSSCSPTPLTCLRYSRRVGLYRLWPWWDGSRKHSTPASPSALRRVLMWRDSPPEVASPRRQVPGRRARRHEADHRVVEGGGTRHVVEGGGPQERRETLSEPPGQRLFLDQPPGCWGRVSPAMLRVTLSTVRSKVVRPLRSSGGAAPRRPAARAEGRPGGSAGGRPRWTPRGRRRPTRRNGRTAPRPG